MQLLQITMPLFKNYLLLVSETVRDCYRNVIFKMLFTLYLKQYYNISLHCVCTGGKANISCYVEIIELPSLIYCPYNVAAALLHYLEEH